MNKDNVRKQMLSSLAGLREEDRKAQDESIVCKAEAIYELQAAECVFAYVGIGNEIETKKIIENMLADGKCVCVPLCHGKGMMDAVKISAMSDLAPGKYGILEPPKAGERINPSEIDAIIVPGVAFDKSCKRLGRGGGYYDRFMSDAENAVKIALCREINLIDEVPYEEHDKSVDIIVTENRVIRKRA